MHKIPMHKKTLSLLAFAFLVFTFVAQLVVAAATCQARAQAEKGSLSSHGSS